MDCGRCGLSNRDTDRFCTGCGGGLSTICAICGADNRPGARFCGGCGSQIDATPRPESAPTRKTVTVLFSDLGGSTALGERMDPESVRSLMSPVYSSMRREVEARGGQVAKFVGDGVMAVFGVPEVREDDALRALDAAVGMREALDQLAADIAREHGAVLSIKFGINTGEVVIAEGDPDIVGDMVNVASRLEGVAAPGEVLVGEDTWRLTRSDATYEPVAPLTLKGKAQPVPAYKLVALERTQEAGTATFVGRDGELSKLVRAFDGAVDANAARVITIIGSPGLGKTRLARELGNALADKALVVETRCDAGGSTFAPVVDALRVATGVDEAASPEAVVAAIEALVPDDEDRTRIAQRAAALFGAGDAGTTEETFWAIRRLMETAAQGSPVVLILDDLHWAEPLMLDLVEHLAEWTRTSPVLIVVTGRPELREIRPSLTQPGRVVDVISLEGLDERATEALACGLLGTDRVPPELLARLPDSTEGNPLFVREFVRMLVDDGVLRRADDAWVTTINVDAIEAPPTIHSLLGARVDRLTPNERTVLELAAVIGKEFYRGAIVELASPALRMGLDGHLESLRRKELVEPAGTYWIDEPVFRFHHALIRDAAYRRLLKESRAELHERVAGWLERKTGGLLDEHHELIGYHLEQAHESRRQLGPLDDHGRDLAARAGALLSSAARVALERDDLPAAAALSGRALERLTDDAEERAETLIIRCEALLATGDVTAAVPAVDELVRSASSPRLEAWGTCFTGELANLTGTEQLQEMAELVAKAAIELSEIGDPAGAAKAHTVYAGALARLGRFAECEATLDRALNAAREADDGRRVTAVLATAPHAAVWGPSPVSRAGGRCLDVVRLLRITTGSPGVEAISARCQALLEALRGRFDAARRMLGDSRKGVEELGLRHDLHEVDLFCGMVELIADQPGAAAEYLLSAYMGFGSMGADVDTARAAALLARAQLQLGAIGEADRLSFESERLGGDDLKSAIAWRGVRAEILAQRGSYEDARRLAQDAVDIGGRTDALFDHGTACAALSAVHRLAGDTDDARRMSERAVSLFERKGATALADYIGGRRDRTASPASPMDQERALTVLDNRCMTLCRSVSAAYTSTAELLELLAEDLEFVDRRRVVSAPPGGRSAAVANVEAALGVGAFPFDLELIATRGERLALISATFRGADQESAFERPLLGIAGIDEHDLLSVIVIFELDDVDAAFGELDSRYFASLDPELLEMSAAWLKYVEILNVSRNMDELGEIVPADVSFVDHRSGPTLGDIHGAGGWIDAVKAFEDVAPGSISRLLAVHRFTSRGAVVQLGVQGATAVGAEFEQAYTTLMLGNTRGGRVEFYDWDDLDRAMARFDVLAAAPVAREDETASDAELDGAEDLDRDVAMPRVDTAAAVNEDIAPIANRATILMERLFEMLDISDWERLSERASPGLHLDDRRLGLGHESDRETTLDQLRFVWETGGQWHGEPVAVRGTTLALMRWTVGGRLGVGASGLGLIQFDDTDRVSTAILFDEDREDEAFAELDELFLASLPTPEAELYRSLQWFVRKLNEGDFEAIRAAVPPDHVQRDLRTEPSLGTVYGTGSVDAMVEKRKLSPDMFLRVVGVPRIAADRMVWQAAVNGTTTDGGRVEYAYVNVLALDADGRHVAERYDWNELDRAIARYDEMGTSTRLTLRENDATRVFDRFVHASQHFQSTADPDDGRASTAMIAPEFRIDDRRTGVSWDFDRRGMLENLRLLRDLRFSHDHLASRGDNHVLTRLSVVSESGYEVDALIVVAVEGDLLTSVVGLDSDAVVDALDELDLQAQALARRNLLGPRDDQVTFENHASRSVDRFLLSAIDERWDDLTEQLAPTFELVDTREGSSLELDKDGMVANSQVLLNLGFVVGDSRREVLATRGESFVLVSLRFVSSNDFELEILYGVEVDETGRFVRAVAFGPDAIGAAIADLDERFARSVAPDVADSVRLAFDLLGVMNAHGGGAALLNDDLVYRDHRTGPAESEVRGQTLGESFMSWVALVPDLRLTVLSVPRMGRGRFVGMTRAHGTADHGGEVEFLDVWFAAFRGGQLVLADRYDVEDLDLAIARYDEIGDGPPMENVATRGARRYLDALVAQDWDALADALSPDYRFIDRRMGFGNEHDKAMNIAQMKNMVDDGGGETAGGARMDVLAIRGERFFLSRLTFFTDSGFEVDTCCAQETDDQGRLLVGILLDPDDADAALAALDELASTDASS